MDFLYIPSGLQERIESGEIKVSKKKKDGSLDIDKIAVQDELVAPRSVWNKKAIMRQIMVLQLLKQ